MPLSPSPDKRFIAWDEIERRGGLARISLHLPVVIIIIAPLARLLMSMQIVNDERAQLSSVHL